MRHIIPTNNISQIEVELLNFNQQTGFSLFRIGFKEYVMTDIRITGETIKQIYEESQKLIKMFEEK